jgi:hypothetical protein
MNESKQAMKKVEARPLPPELRGLESMTNWMDSRFRIPGTDFRFGLDSVIGLIPGIGDLSMFGVSAYIVLLMAKNGASGFVLARMILNILIDAALGAIPFVGDLFDFVHKANRKNMQLMRQYYVEGRHRGSAWKVIVPVLIVLGLILAGIIWLLYRLITSLF